MKTHRFVRFNQVNDTLELNRMLDLGWSVVRFYPALDGVEVSLNRDVPCENGETTTMREFTRRSREVKTVPTMAEFYCGAECPPRGDDR